MPELVVEYSDLADLSQRLVIVARLVPYGYTKGIGWELRE